MTLIRQSDYEARSKLMLERVSEEMVAITPERAKIVARRLINEVRRNYRRSLEPYPAAAILGKIEARDVEAVLDAATQAQDLLREAVIALAGPECAFALSSRPKRVGYQDDDGQIKACYIVLSELIDVPDDDNRILVRQDLA